MAKVTSKLQVTLRKRIAGIAPGDEITFEGAGDVTRVVPAGRQSASISLEERLRLFDEAPERQRHRASIRPMDGHAPKERGWRREDLYDRGKPD